MNKCSRLAISLDKHYQRNDYFQNINPAEIISWLLEGDLSIQYQTHRDLLGEERPDLQHQIATKGWGKIMLDKRNPDGHWGDRFYQPKWISTHYTLLDLRNLNVSPENEKAKETIKSVIETHKAEDGGIQLGPSTSHRSDVCVNGMFLNYAAYFGIETLKLKPIIDALLNEWMPDGGFNCRSTRSGARHSSLHSTISVLEGFDNYLKRGHEYRIADVLKAKHAAEVFILQHQFFLSDRTGEIIHKDFLKLRYPCRWKYDLLRGLDYFQLTNHSWDPRMETAIEELLKKRKKDGTWNLAAAHPGQVHVKMEKAGKSSRWNTLRALRVLKHFEIKFIVGS